MCQNDTNGNLSCPKENHLSHKGNQPLSLRERMGEGDESVGAGEGDEFVGANYLRYPLEYKNGFTPMRLMRTNYLTRLREIIPPSAV